MVSKAKRTLKLIKSGWYNSDRSCTIINKELVELIVYLDKRITKLEEKK